MLAPLQGFNAYLPNGQTLDRFLWTIKHLVAAGVRLGCCMLHLACSATRAAACLLQHTSTQLTSLTAPPSHAGMYVLVDYHPLDGTKRPRELTSYSTSNFIESWKWIWTSIVGLDNYHSHLKGRLFLDLLNEPDSQGQRWEPHNDRAGITALYLGVMDALVAIDPNVSARASWLLAAAQGGYLAQIGRAKCCS
jgi:hypothetical protein